MEEAKESKKPEKAKEVKVKQKDFVEIDYTAKVGDIVFDTTSQEVAKANNIFDEKAVYKPVIVCVGQGNVIRGLDKELVGKEIKKTYKVHITPEQGFGKKSPKLLQLIPTSRFLKEGITPVPGLHVNVNGIFGVVKTVSGGRTIVDFNHPLAGKELDYGFKINRVVVDNKEKIESIVRIRLGLRDFSVDIINDTAKIILKAEINEKLKSLFEEEVKKLIPNIKKVEFKVEEKKEENTKKKTKV